MSPKIGIGGLSCEYEVSAEKNSASVHCVSQRFGVPYPCALDEHGKIKKEISGPFGNVSLDSRKMEKTENWCALSGIAGELTLKKGIDDVRNTVKNKIAAVLKLVL
jgi:hypothetical protein